MSQSFRLNVVHLISGLGQGGAEAVLYNLIAHAPANQQHIVISLTGDGVYGERLRALGLKVYCINLSLKNMCKLVRLRRLLSQLKASGQLDVLQTWMYHANLLGCWLAPKNVPVVWGIRNSGANLKANSRSSYYSARLGAKYSAKVAKVICCAILAQTNHLAMGYASQNMTVIHNGYDFAKWKFNEHQRQKWRTKLKLADDVPLLISVARFNPLKDHATLIEAIALVRDKLPNVHALLIGKDIDEHNVVLTAQIQRLNLQSCISLWSLRDDVEQIMSAADVFVLSSIAEGFPNVVCEAMASGVPCVVTDVGDAALIVNDPAKVCPIQNPSALALNVVAQIEQNIQQGRMAVAQDVMHKISRFSIENMVQEYTAVWHDVTMTNKD